MASEPFRKERRRRVPDSIPGCLAINYLGMPGTNTIDFYPQGHVSYREQHKAQINTQIKAIRLEKFP